MVQISLWGSIEEISPRIYYESGKLIWVTYLVTLPNMRQCERIQNQTSFNKVLKTHVMLLNVGWISDYAYEYVSNVTSLKIIDNSWLRCQKFDSRNKYVFHKCTHNGEWNILHSRTINMYVISLYG
jgi:hypothetical protein